MAASWSGSRRSNRIQGRGATSRAQGGLPSVVLPLLVSPCFRVSRMTACRAPLNAGLRPPPSAADGIDRSPTGRRRLLIEQRQERADEPRSAGYLQTLTSSG